MTATSSRSGVLLGAAGLALHGGAAAAAGYVVLLVLPCHWAPLQALATGACGAPAWPFPAYPWLAAALLAALTAGWLANLAGAAGRQLGSTRRKIRSLLAVGGEPSPRLRRAADAAGLHPADVVEVPAPQPLAFVHGMLRPQAVVTRGALDVLDDDELAAAVCHEAAHVRRRDPLRLVAIRAVARAAFAFPMLRDLADRAMVDCELAADRAAVEHVGKAALASAIAKVRSCAGTSFDADAVASIDGFAERVRHLSTGEAPPVRLAPSRLVPTLVAAALLIVVTVPAVQALRAASNVTVTRSEATP